MVLIGSHAIAMFIPDWMNGRNTMDYDFIATKAEMQHLIKQMLTRHKLLKLAFKEGTNKACAFFFNNETNKNFVLEFNLVDEEFRDKSTWQSDLVIHDALLGLVSISIEGIEIRVQCPTIAILYMIKLSHRYLRNSPHFNKTMNDIRMIRDHYPDIDSHVHRAMPGALELREKLTYNYGHPVLKQNKDTFFDDTVPYKYDHDTIHEAVKHLEHPAYTYYMVEGAQVMCSREKFDNLDHSVKLLGVLEESYVLALERSIIPYDSFNDAEKCHKAFKMALMKVCTSITSGWFREFAWENYETVLEMYEYDFVKKFMIALQEGKIKPFERKVY